MKPLRITFRLSGQTVAPDRPLHLDALLAFAAFQSAVGGLADMPPCKEKDAELIRATEVLPLDKIVGEDGEWCWKASQLHFAQIGGIEWHQYTRRYEINRWAADSIRGYWRSDRTKGKDVIAQSTGSMKSFLLQQPLAQFDSATAWCVGDRDAVEAMLRGHVYSLGRSRRMGWGRIAETIVEVAPEAEAGFWARRTLPASLEAQQLPGHFVGTATVRPPYWDRAARRAVLEFDASATVMEVAPAGARAE